MKLAIDGVQFSYHSKEVLKSVSLDLGKGEVMSLVGPNGSGKTTLLKCINKILKPQKGQILIDSNNIGQINLKAMAKILGYVPQSAATSFPLTVFDMVMLGRKPHVDWGIGLKDKEIVFNIINMMDLGELTFRLFNELSGGEKQKVLMARALAQEPGILLLDEPTSNLDLKHQMEVMSLVVEMVKQKELSAVMAIHDLNLASSFRTNCHAKGRGYLAAGVVMK
jgi:iron complex transport system ATP-binding protein